MTFALVMAPACRDAGLTDAYMALDSGGMLQRTLFYTDTATIYCVGKLDSGVADVSVSAVVRASSLYVSDRDAFVPVDEIVAVSDADQTPGMGQSVVAFQLNKAVSDPSIDSSDVPFNPGTYVCDLYVNGDLDRSVPFAIDFPACPVAPPVDGGPCAGWVRPSSTCAGAQAGVECTCGSKGTWSCSSP
jgi:hypothetical protein